MFSASSSGQRLTERKPSVYYGRSGVGENSRRAKFGDRQATLPQRGACCFLSGNGPLVQVLREALARDAVERQKSAGQKTTKADEARRTSSFVQNIHHFRDDALRSDDAPVEKVAIFDEAQRAWDAPQTAKFMKERGRLDFSMCEPEFL